MPSSQHNMNTLSVIMRNMLKLQKKGRDPRISPLGFDCERCYMCFGYGHDYKECSNEEPITFEEYLELEQIYAKQEIKDENFVGSLEIMEKKVENFESDSNQAENNVLIGMTTKRFFDCESLISTPIEMIQDPVKSQENSPELSSSDILENQSEQSLNVRKIAATSGSLDSFIPTQCFARNFFNLTPMETIQVSLESTEVELQFLCFEDLEKNTGNCKTIQWKSQTSVEPDRMESAKLTTHHFQHSDPNLFIQDLLESSKNSPQLLFVEFFEKETLRFSKFLLKLLLSRIPCLVIMSLGSKGSIKDLLVREAHIHEDKLAADPHILHLKDLRSNLFKEGEFDAGASGSSKSRFFTICALSSFRLFLSYSSLSSFVSTRIDMGIEMEVIYSLFELL